MTRLLIALLLATAALRCTAGMRVLPQLPQGEKAAMPNGAPQC